MADPDERRPHPDVVITEVGGTVGDIESLPFLEAIRQVRHEIGRDNVLLPARLAGAVPGAVRRAEDQADPALGGRAAQHRYPARRAGLPLRPGDPGRSSSASSRSTATSTARPWSPAPDAPSIYDIPKVLHREGLDAYVVRRLGLSFRDVDWTAWDDLLERVHHPRHEVTVALVGKYVDLPDAYLSVTEAIRAAGFAHRARVQICAGCPATTARPRQGAAAALTRRRRRRDPRRLRRARHRGQDRRGRGTPGRTASRPSGLCLGPAVHGDRGGPQPGRARTAPTRSEFDERTPAPGHLDDGRPGGHRRRQGRPGRHDAAGRVPGEAGRRARSSPRPTARPRSTERHRHRYEVNNAYRDALDQGRPADLRHLAGRPAGRVRRAGPRGAPVLRGHAGAPGAQEPARPGRTRCSRRSSRRRSRTLADQLPVGRSRPRPSLTGRRVVPSDGTS